MCGLSRYIYVWRSLAAVQHITNIQDNYGADVELQRPPSLVTQTKLGFNLKIVN